MLDMFVGPCFFVRCRKGLLLRSGCTFFDAAKRRFLLEAEGFCASPESGVLRTSIFFMDFLGGGELPVHAGPSSAPTVEKPGFDAA